MSREIRGVSARGNASPATADLSRVGDHARQLIADSCDGVALLGDREANILGRRTAAIVEGPWRRTSCPTVSCRERKPAQSPTTVR
jgi:hypothetical protein